MELLDTQKQINQRKPLWTIRLLILSTILFLLLLVVSTADKPLGIPHRFLMTIIPFLVLGGMLSSLIGITFGFRERKRNKLRAIVGIVGNILILVLNLGLILFALFIVLQIQRVG